MANKLFIIQKSSPYRCSIYPNDIDDVIRKYMSKVNALEELIIHRENGLLVYLYVVNLGVSSKIGLCILSDKLCSDIGGLICYFQTISKELCKQGLLQSSSFFFPHNQFKNKRVLIDIFLREKQESLDKLFSKSKNVPALKIDIQKNDVVPCVWGKHDSQWILSQIETGYHNVFIILKEKKSKLHENSSLLSSISEHISAKVIIYVVLLTCLILLLMGYKVPLLNKINNLLTAKEKVETVSLQKEKNNLANNVIKSASSQNKDLCNKDTVKFVRKDTTKTTYTTKKEESIREIRKNLTTAIPSNFIFVPSGKLTHLFVDYDEQVNPIYKNFSVNSYYICKYEVTQKEYKAIMGKNPSKYIGEELPVHNITNAEALIFCQKKSEKEGYDGFYIIKGSKVFLKQKGNGYRLPTDHEWAFAARKGNEAKAYKYAAGNNLNDIAWYGRNSNNRPHKIGLKKPNDRGLYDMCGNVGELAHIGRKEIWSKGGSYEEWPYDGHVFHEDDARGYSGGGINSKEKDPTAGIRLVFIPKGMEPSFKF